VAIRSQLAFSLAARSGVADVSDLIGPGVKAPVLWPERGRAPARPERQPDLPRLPLDELKASRGERGGRLSTGQRHSGTIAKPGSSAQAIKQLGDSHALGPIDGCRGDWAGQLAYGFQLVVTSIAVTTP